MSFSLKTSTPCTLAIIILVKFSYLSFTRKTSVYVVISAKDTLRYDKSMLIFYGDIMGISAQYVQKHKITFIY
ncbi:hypothetical protein AZA_28951 [Nitrospirillum viridazoti Y2]|nr:hypothetical protein AZA_28951 [Nitrospirillum amazonense Y2]